MVQTKVMNKEQAMSALIAAGAKTLEISGYKAIATLDASEFERLSNGNAGFRKGSNLIQVQMQDSQVMEGKFTLWLYVGKPSNAAKTIQVVKALPEGVNLADLKLGENEGYEGFTNATDRFEHDENYMPIKDEEGKIQYYDGWNPEGDDSKLPQFKKTVSDAAGEKAGEEVKEGDTAKK